MKKIIPLVLILVLSIATEVTQADFTIGEPTNLGPTVNSSSRDENAGISADGLTLYFCSLRPGGHGNYDILVSTRATTEDS